MEYHQDQEIRWLRSAVSSLMDIVQELAVAMEEGTRAEHEWVKLVRSTLNQHRINLGLEIHE